MLSVELYLFTYLLGPGPNSDVFISFWHDKKN